MSENEGRKAVEAWADYEPFDLSMLGSIYANTRTCAAVPQAALTDEQIREIWLRVTGYDEQAAPFAIIEFARAILATHPTK